jgi:hypothetical protein
MKRSASTFPRHFLGLLTLAVLLSAPSPRAADPEKAEPGENETVVETRDGEVAYRISIDTRETPDLTEWARSEVAPMCREWYPRLVRMLPGPDYHAPTNVTITFSAEMKGVAATGGTRIRCAAAWFRQNLKGEGKGAIFHELIHVVQNYGWGRRNNPNAARVPGWIVEGIPDYIRWFVFEPERKGAEITKRNVERARYDGNYRISANFLNWVVTKYDKELVPKLNAEARAGKYREELWKEYTGKTVQELGEQWHAENEARLKDADK